MKVQDCQSKSGEEWSCWDCLPLAPFIPRLSLEVMDGLAPVLQTETEAIQFRATDE